MDGSFVVQFFPSRKLNALAYTIHANIHSDMHIIIYTRKNMVCLDSWKGLLKKDSFELVFELREGGKIPKTGRQLTEFQTDGAMKLKERSYPLLFQIRIFPYRQFTSYNAQSGHTINAQRIDRYSFHSYTKFTC